MFNLLVKVWPWATTSDAMMRSRAFEYTGDDLIQRFQPAGQLDFPALNALPTLFVQESAGPDTAPARVGTVIRAYLHGRDVRLEYALDPDIAPIPHAQLEGFAGELGIERAEFSRTHWAVKDFDLFRSLLRHQQPRRMRPRVFHLGDPENVEPSLVSLMMPFGAEFNPVHQALRVVVEAAGLRCRRADDIWENPAVIQDVVSLIDRSVLVIADCSGKNPNVFYEIGIAHTLGKDVVLITQANEDIPFDLRHLRYVRYLNNGEGLANLRGQLAPRLAQLVD